MNMPGAEIPRATRTVTRIEYSDGRFIEIEANDPEPALLNLEVTDQGSVLPDDLNRAYLNMPASVFIGPRRMRVQFTTGVPSDPGTPTLTVRTGQMPGAGAAAAAPAATGGPCGGVIADGVYYGGGGAGDSGQRATITGGGGGGRVLPAERGGHGMSGDGTWTASDGHGCQFCGAYGRRAGHGGGCPNAGVTYRIDGTAA